MELHPRSHPARLVASFVVASLTVALSLLGLGIPASAADPVPPAGHGKSAAAKGRGVHASRVALGRSSENAALPTKARGRQARSARAAVVEDVAVVGVTLTGDATGADLFVREVTGGATGEWTRLDVEVDGSGAAATDPFVVSRVDAVEVAMLSTTATAELQVYASAPTAADATAASASATATTVTARTATAMSATSSQYAWPDPQIMSRSAWSADESIVRGEYDYALVTGVMIHHTAGSNTYAAADVPSILRSIQAYHVNGRGWKDIAYNVLVDRFGRAWEGRGGGIDRAVQGGHAWGVTNARVFGLSFMGNFDTVTAPSIMLDTAERVIAWKFRLHGVKPDGQTWGSGGQDGGSTSLPAISAHRNENATACPGANVYSRMGEIRTKVAGYLNTATAQPGPALSTFTTAGAPTVSGTPQVEKTLTAKVADWVPAASFSYQWYRVDSAGASTSISGATASTYTLTSTDRGYRMKVRVVGSQSGYTSVSKDSSLTGAVAYGVFTTTPTPTVSGTAQVGLKLTAKPGTWSPAATFKYQWYRVSSDGTSASISGATSSSYTLTSSDRGKRVKVRVSGYRPGFTTVRNYSSVTSSVAYGVFSVQTPPTTSGTVRSGSTLTARHGTWTPAASFAYQWYRVSSSGTVSTISGATSSTYKLGSADRSRQIKVKVTAKRSGYRSVTMYSALTVRVP